MHTQKLEKNWQQKTVAYLEKQDFGDPKDGPTRMVRRCLELCRVPVEDFTIEDLRLMIGQGFALRYLTLLAIDRLRIDPLAEGNLFPGDLLSNVLNIDPKFWLENNPLWIEISSLIKDSREDLATEGIKTKKFDAVFESQSKSPLDSI